MGKWLLGQDLRKLWENSFFGQDHGRFGSIHQDLESLGIGVLVMVLESLGKQYRGGQDLKSCFEICMHRCILYA